MKKSFLFIVLLSSLSSVAVSQQYIRNEIKKADTYVWPWTRSEVYRPTTDIKELWMGWSDLNRHDSLYWDVAPGQALDSLSREDIIQKIERLTNEIRPYNEEAASVMTCLVAMLMMKKEMPFANYCEIYTESSIQSLINGIEDLRNRTKLLRDELMKEQNK